MTEGFTPWPAEVARGYRERGLWAGERLDRIAVPHAVARPEATAIVDAEGEVSYRELEWLVRAAGTRMRESGIDARDRVVLQLPNRRAFVITALALMRIGALPVYALPAHAETELTAIADSSGAFALIADARRPETLERARRAADAAVLPMRVLADEGIVPARVPGREPEDPAAPVDPGEMAFLQLSGGTTGAPKLIPRTHDDYHYSVRRSVEVCRLDASDTMLILLPAAHNFPMSSPGFLGVLHAGGTVVLAEPTAPQTVFALIRRTASTIIPLVPPLALALVGAAERSGEDVAATLPTLRTVQVGGAKLAPELAGRIRPALGGRVQQVFGMAEGLVCYTDPEDDSDRPLHVQGCPMSPEDEVRIVGPEGREVPRGTPGELQTRGPYTIRGYYRNPEADARSFTDDGFYCTGDIVQREPDGSIVVQGRSKDHINRGGEKISAEEVENLLLGHPKVHDAIVVGVPDPYLGERAVGIVVPADDSLTPQELTAHMRGLRVDPIKTPERFEFRDSLPTTGVGKISRAALRRALRETVTA